MSYCKKDVTTSLFGLNYIILIVAFMWVGCSTLTNDSQEDLVTYETSQNSFSVGSLVRTELENKSDASITYNLCLEKLEHKKNGEWIFVGPQIMCQSDAKRLNPGEKIQGAVHLSDSLQLSEGEYQITTTVGYEDGNKKLTTQTFNVSAKDAD